MHFVTMSYFSQLGVALAACHLEMLTPPFLRQQLRCPCYVLYCHVPLLFVLVLIPLTLLTRIRTFNTPEKSHGLTFAIYHARRLKIDLLMQHSISYCDLSVTYIYSGVMDIIDTQYQVEFVMTLFCLWSWQ